MPRRGETAVVPIDADGRGHGGPKGAHGHRGQHRPRPPQQEFRPFRRWSPFLVPLFVAANVGFFALSMYVNDCPAHAAAADAALGGAAEAPGCLLQSDLGRFAFQPYRENPLIGPTSATLLEMGALETSKVAKDHEWWRLITCIWLHAGVIHILANMLSLLLIGMRLEREFGFLRIGTLYVISGVGGSLLSALFMASNISVGASGALFGLLGSMLSELITNWTIYENKCAALLTLVLIIALNLAVGILPHVDNFAHIGGFVSGFFLGFVLLMRPQFAYINQKNSPLGLPPGTAKCKYKTYQIILLVISLVILICGFVVGFVLLMKGFNPSEQCSWCHYLSCVPTSKWSCKAPGNYCVSSQLGDQLNLTCQSTGKTGTYVINNPSNAEALNHLCLGLCS